MRLSEVKAQTETPIYFRGMIGDDIPRLVELGELFFAESDMPEIGDYSPENFKKHLIVVLNANNHACLVFEDQGQIEGFILFAMGAPYTKEPVCFGDLLYVSPEYRKSPAGRILIETAEAEAKAAGCTAFYMGAMAGIPSVARTLPNMFRKLGFKEMPFWGRKNLNG